MKNLWRERRSKPVIIWLLIGVLMIIVQIILGGITRLTDSGLSITEWKPLLGTLPPLTDAQWAEAFNSYKGIAQYKHLHAYFTLSDFKTIFFWEWMHRLWGRVIGIVFLIPFLIFLIQKRFNKEMVKPMLILFLLGGLQGLIGWLMVKSGLNDEDLYVSHIRLAIHFITALTLMVYVFWFALQLGINKSQMVPTHTSKKLLMGVIGLLGLQLIYGAFMAGLKAAMIAPTWPDINGSYWPNFSAYAGKTYSFFSSLVNNPLVVHFIHRNLAYLFTILVIVWTIRTSRQQGSPLFNTVKWAPLFFVALQVILGIAAVVTSVKKVPQQWGVFEWNAQLHQFVALMLLLSLVANLALLQRAKSAAVEG